MRKILQLKDLLTKRGGRTTAFHVIKRVTDFYAVEQVKIRKRLGNSQSDEKPDFEILL
ncbi:hypothetical protein PMI15_01988 [Polaromonas sp. CF318]|nr:hypothetical protein PMI15_01988 [Polaromonas sp. CF318]